MTELVLFGENLPIAPQSTKAEAAARSERIRAGLVVIATFSDDVKAAWAARDWAALGYESWHEYAEGEYGESRLPAISRERRRELVADLRGASMSTRAIAAVLQVSDQTVRADLEQVRDFTHLGDESAQPPTSQPARITGADGKTYAGSRSTPPSWPTSVTRSAPPATSPSATPRPEPSMFDDIEIVDAEIVEDAPPSPPADPEASWSEDEKRLAKLLRDGETVVVSLRGQHANLIAWAEPRGLYTRIDRRTEWGNPFELPGDGDRDTVIGNYAAHYLPYKASLVERRIGLLGKALGCWCAPEPCHGDVLKAWAEDDIDAMDGLASGATRIPHMDEWLTDVKGEVADR